jgi:predicted HicB family RNase H-like nuclease|nr:type II toxin-antitoxin system HicB family antitoxin [uncultured Limnobacter sp.]
MTKFTDRYTYRVTWSEEDQEYVGLCAEFQSLSWLDKSPEKALTGIRTLVRECVADMERAKEPIPEPLSIKKFSGKFMVRIPPETHRNLAMQAAEEGVSLNRLISSRLH